MTDENMKQDETMKASDTDISMDDSQATSAQADKAAEDKKAAKLAEELGTTTKETGSVKSFDEHSERVNSFRIWVLLGVLAIFTIAVIASVLFASTRVPDNVGYELEGADLETVQENNSSLIDYGYLTPNATFPRENEITKITIHHMGDALTLNEIGEVFMDHDRQSSANYAIDVDGNVGIYVEEANRSWASSNRDNDSRAVTIEVANSESSLEWPISEESYNTLIDLIVDICERNGIEELNYTGDSTGNLTYHMMFSRKTDCPGPYLIDHMDDIANDVNERLGN